MEGRHQPYSQFSKCKSQLLKSNNHSEIFSESSEAVFPRPFGRAPEDPAVPRAYPTHQLYTSQCPAQEEEKEWETL